MIGAIMCVQLTCPMGSPVCWTMSSLRAISFPLSSVMRQAKGLPPPSSTFFLASSITSVRRISRRSSFILLKPDVYTTTTTATMVMSLSLNTGVTGQALPACYDHGGRVRRHGIRRLASEARANSFRSRVHMTFAFKCWDFPSIADTPIANEHTEL